MVNLRVFLIISICCIAKTAQASSYDNNRILQEIAQIQEEEDSYQKVCQQRKIEYGAVVGLETVVLLAIVGFYVQGTVIVGPVIAAGIPIFLTVVGRRVIRSIDSKRADLSRDLRFYSEQLAIAQGDANARALVVLRLRQEQIRGANDVAASYQIADARKLIAQVVNRLDAEPYNSDEKKILLTLAAFASKMTSHNLVSPKSDFTYQDAVKVSKALADGKNVDWGDPTTW